MVIFLVNAGIRLCKFRLFRECVFLYEKSPQVNFLPCPLTTDLLPSVFQFPVKAFRPEVTYTVGWTLITKYQSVCSELNRWVPDNIGVIMFNRFSVKQSCFPSFRFSEEGEGRERESVCVCVCVREREREADRQTDK